MAAMSHFGATESDLLGVGGEACVFAWTRDKVLRIHHTGAQRRTIDGRAALLKELAASASLLPFAIPSVLSVELLSERWVTIETRLPGRPLAQVLSTSTGSNREALIVRLLECAHGMQRLRVDRAWYGDLCEGAPVRAANYRDYLRDRAAESLAHAGSPLIDVSAVSLAAALPEPAAPSFVHLDLYAGNVLIEDNQVTAVVDFGSVPIVGDPRLDPLSAAAYLTPYITPTATDADRQVAREWLQARGLLPFFQPVSRWLAARWSHAVTDANLHAWCRATLLGDPDAQP